MGWKDPQASSGESVPMWPWGHLAVGYLCYVAVLRIRGRGEQTLATLFAVVLGTQFPDLVDKPLAWTFAVLPSGRSFAHSLLIAGLLLAGLAVVGKRRDRLPAVGAFAVGYLSHIVTDLGPSVVLGLLNGDWSQLEWTTYLLWPVLPAPPYPHDSSFIEHFVAFELSTYVAAQFLLLGIAGGVWIAHGQPGAAQLRRWLLDLLPP